MPNTLFKADAILDFYFKCNIQTIYKWDLVLKYYSECKKFSFVEQIITLQINL